MLPESMLREYRISRLMSDLHYHSTMREIAQSGKDSNNRYSRIFRRLYWVWGLLMVWHLTYALFLRSEKIHPIEIALDLITATLFCAGGAWFAWIAVKNNDRHNAMEDFTIIRHSEAMADAKAELEKINVPAEEV